MKLTRIQIQQALKTRVTVKMERELNPRLYAKRLAEHYLKLANLAKDLMRMTDMMESELPPRVLQSILDHIEQEQLFDFGRLLTDDVPAVWISLSCPHCGCSESHQPYAMSDLRECNRCAGTWHA